MEPARLGTSTWTDLGESIVVVPVGACEQHGPHLPLATDTVIACALADDLSTRRGDCVVAPPLTITASGEHQGFPGTLSIGTEAMSAVVVEIVRSATWAAGVVFVNGHGGNHEAMQHAQAVLRHERRNVLVWWPQIEGGDLHAGRTETSLMLALDPGHVRVERAAAGPIPDLDALRRQGVRALSENGVLGDPDGASAEEGTMIFADLAGQLADAVERWRTS